MAARRGNYFGRVRYCNRRTCQVWQSYPHHGRQALRPGARGFCVLGATGFVRKFRRRAADTRGFIGHRQCHQLKSGSGHGSSLAAHHRRWIVQRHHPIPFRGVGETTLSVDVASGFRRPAQFTSVTATVSAPQLTVTEQLVIGANLEIAGAVLLGAEAPQGGLTVSLASGDPSRLTPVHVGNRARIEGHYHHNATWRDERPILSSGARGFGYRNVHCGSARDMAVTPER